ncbi:S-adenosylmethionine:tRNA ribosyltransferase-isomerase [Enhygromyxa salina]|uniref:S-adenosylmethionine:tRNA ribosyltransferase-isomerase n=1 Tax=Enhygromyxa salina TaxID=215803 RepID=A0A2S9XUI6_9BACT|nr:S-adenosylmethionine:tRNA ribosyltransferase-isomerase [Enhygromyxa salina]PRP96539.1 S-adenosylmethionine:tRNA ribosyltransferase-isomerase [Enhygromyxa salina]
MSPATHPPSLREGVRLLLVDEAADEIRDAAFAELVDELRPGDLLVVNDAATLPASIAGRVRGQTVELRLLGPRLDDESGGDRQWRAVLFGSGDWRDDTDDRPAPPVLELGATIELRGGLSAALVGRHPDAERLVDLCFDRGGPELHAALYAAGRPIQYSHLDQPLELWSVQTVFAGRPWAAEMPSAGRPLTAALLGALRARGVELARLTHAAGLSATGDPGLDALLPLPERYEIPAETVAAIERARARGGRVIAAGTTVVRALEGAVAGAVAGEGLVAGGGETALIITAQTELRVVDGLLTGMHASHESHYRLLRAFAPDELLERAWDAALGAGYRSHEFGDLALLLPTARRAA